MEPFRFIAKWRGKFSISLHTCTYLLVTYGVVRTKNASHFCSLLSHEFDRLFYIYFIFITKNNTLLCISSVAATIYLVG